MVTIFYKQHVYSYYLCMCVGGAGASGREGGRERGVIFQRHGLSLNVFEFTAATVLFGALYHRSICEPLHVLFWRRRQVSLKRCDSTTSSVLMTGERRWKIFTPFWDRNCAHLDSPPIYILWKQSKNFMKSRKSVLQYVRCKVVYIYFFTAYFLLANDTRSKTYSSLQSVGSNRR